MGEKLNNGYWRSCYINNITIMMTSRLRKTKSKNAYLTLTKLRKAKNTSCQEIDLTIKTKCNMQTMELVDDWFQVDIRPKSSNYKHSGLYPLTIDYTHRDDDDFIIHINETELNYKRTMIKKLNDLKRVLIFKKKYQTTIQEMNSLLLKGW